MEVLKMEVERKQRNGRYAPVNYLGCDDKAYWLEKFAEDMYGCLKKYKDYRFKRTTNYDGTAYVVVSYGNDSRTRYLVKE